MAVKHYKPVTNGRRNMSSLDYSKNLSGHAPEKSLLVILKKTQVVTTKVKLQLDTKVAV
nr:hypothetical protein [Mycoplasmopsis bovis]